jgi:hypothetical protein
MQPAIPPHPPEPPERHRASTLTGQDVRLLRQQAGLSIAQLAALLDCHPYTLRTLESNPARRLGRPLARALLLVVAPGGVAHVEAAIAHARTVLARITPVQGLPPGPPLTAASLAPPESP